VLQNNELRRIGGTQTIKVDVRFVAATNKNLEAMIGSGAFREDLFFRLNAITLSMPALRDRPEDIPALVERFLGEFGDGKAGSDKHVVSKQVSAEVAAILQAYNWPGNIRELRNAIMYACAMSGERIIGVADLPPSLRVAPSQGIRSGTFAPGFDISSSTIQIESQRQPQPATGSAQAPESSKYGLDPRSVAEAEVLRSVLAGCGYNKKRCAEILRMSRNTLYRKLAQYGIQDQGKPDD
jgi:DNA-binding NtrC family response regulator